MDIEALVQHLKLKKRIVSTTSKEPPKSHRRLYFFLSKILVLVIMFLGVLIYTRSSESNKTSLYEKIFNQNLSFTSFNNFYNKYLGGILPFKNLFQDNKPVFNEKLSYKGASIYKDGVGLTVEKNYLVPIQDNGIVVFVGDKTDYGKTVIIQQVNGINLWYGNVNNLNVKIYDYVEKGDLLGETIGDKLYLVYEKEGKYLDYKSYLK